MLEEAKDVRERVSNLYCLPAEMWLEWIEDEKRQLTPEDSPAQLLPLFERALHDYKYYKICRKYCKHLSFIYETFPD
jgi:hypothetical protein